jgi:Uncharacterized conserved protein
MRGDREERAMFNLFEIIQSAQGGTALDNFARQFGLSNREVERAVEALLPAFTVGLQRTAQDPSGLMGMFGLMGAGRYQAPFEDPAQAFSVAGRSEGNDVLAQIFGSPEVSRQVAAQAAAVSGVSQEIIKKMLPILAALLMGGLAKGASNQGLGGLLEQFGKMFGAPAPSGPAPSAERRQPSGGSDIFGQLSDMIQQGGFPGMPGAQPQAQSPQQQDADAPPQPRNPLEELFDTFLGGLAGRPADAAGTQAERGAAAAQQPSAPFDREAIGRMFQAGRDIQEQQMATMRAILDSFGKPRG